MLAGGTRRVAGRCVDAGQRDDLGALAAAWDATHSAPPQLMGQLFHYFDSPNRFGLPPFYTLHVWAWKESPTGAFVNWHSNVSCNAFSGGNQ